ncbi:30S ribosomal protein S16 [Candidatus Desantisbacteria bacterium]|nr:30S ribosomal protein S16 [Candidatus Desantisbacteria bacterium]
MNRIVVIDSRSARDANVIERVGYYHPVSKEAVVSFDEEKTLDWLKKGAQPTPTVRNLLGDKGLLKKFHETKQVSA